MENKAIATLQEPSNLSTLMKVAKWYNPEMPDQALEARVMQEVGYFEYACLLNDNLATCNPGSILMMLRWVIQNDLSIDPQAGLVYLKTRNVKQSDGSFIKTLDFSESSEGALSIAYSTGTIIDHLRPKVHYSSEEHPKVIAIDFTFQVGTERWETVSYGLGDFNKWRTASHTDNARGANDADLKKLNKANKNYTSYNGGIDPEFASSKAITHGLSKRGTNRIAPKRALGAAAIPVQHIAPTAIPSFRPAIDGPAHPIAAPVNKEVLMAEMVAKSDAEATIAAPAPIALTLEQEQAKAEAEFHQPDSYTWTPEAEATPAAQSAIPLDFAPDPIHAALEACSTMAELGNLFTANKDKVLASDVLKSSFKAREIAINENRISTEKAGLTSAPAETPALAPVPKITANDL